MKASISRKAEIGHNVKIGYGAVITDNVKIGEGCMIGEHAVITGHTTIGENCQIHVGAVIGNITQALAYKGDESFVWIGNSNIIREYVTINATEGKETPTVIGNNNLLMAYSHIAHHCEIGDNVIIANAGTLGGHVKLGDHAMIGGLAGVHQFCTIGSYAIVGGLTKIVKDVIPFVTCDGNPASLHGLNMIGLKRGGFSADEISELKKAYRILFRSGLNTADAVKRLEAETGGQKNVSIIIDFIKQCSRGIIKERGEN